MNKQITHLIMILGFIIAISATIFLKGVEVKQIKVLNNLTYQIENNGRF